MKFYYNVKWPIHWRLGFAEGLSYAREVTNLEQREMDLKEYRASNLLNFIDIRSIYNVGDLLRVNAMAPCGLVTASTTVRQFYGTSSPSYALRAE